MKKYQAKPFTEELAEHFRKEMLKPCDDKRTLCNVIKLAFRSASEVINLQGKKSHNLPAVRALLVEALWMGQRMSAKLEENRKKELDDEYPKYVEDDSFGVDWTDLSKGNWD